MLDSYLFPFVFFRWNINLVVKPQGGTLLDHLGGYSNADLLEMAASPASEIISLTIKIPGLVSIYLCLFTSMVVGIPS